MEKLYYESPSLERKKDALEFVDEFKRYNSKLPGSGGLDNYYDNYEEWLIKLEEDKNLKPGGKIVPAETFFLVRESDNRIIGITNIRLSLNESLKKFGGHIGYSISPTERRKGYNKINLYLALQECQKNGIDIAILTCDKANIASSKTMTSLGAQLQFEYELEGIIEQNYSIDVDKALDTYKDEYSQLIKQR